MGSSNTATLVRLKSPFNGEVIAMEFVGTQPPTLAALLQIGFERVDDPKAKPKRKDDEA